jgi:hypothetical protein
MLMCPKPVGGLGVSLFRFLSGIDMMRWGGGCVPPHASALGTAAAQTAREESFMVGRCRLVV